MTETIKASQITILENLKILIKFKNGEKKILDISPYCTGAIFNSFLTDFELFKTAKLDKLGGIEWSNGACLSPETIYLRSKSI